MSGTVHRLRIRNASQVLTVCARGERVLCGIAMSHVSVVERREDEKGGGVGLVVDLEGKIAAVGYDSDIDAMMEGGRELSSKRAVARVIILTKFVHIFNGLYTTKQSII